MGFLGEVEVLGGVDPFGCQGADLLLEDAGLNKDAVAYHVDLVFVENAGRDDMEDMLDAAKLNGVTGVGAALETGYDIVLWGEDINDFSFALVSPLETQQNIYFAHYIIIYKNTILKNRLQRYDFFLL